MFVNCVGKLCFSGPALLISSLSVCVFSGPALLLYVRIDFVIGFCEYM